MPTFLIPDSTCSTKMIYKTYQRIFNQTNIVDILYDQLTLQVDIYKLGKLLDHK